MCDTCTELKRENDRLKAENAQLRQATIALQGASQLIGPLAHENVQMRASLANAEELRRQHKEFEAVKADNDALRATVDALRKENTLLRMENELLKERVGSLEEHVKALSNWRADVEQKVTLREVAAKVDNAVMKYVLSGSRSAPYHIRSWKNLLTFIEFFRDGCQGRRPNDIAGVLGYQAFEQLSEPERRTIYDRVDCVFREADPQSKLIACIDNLKNSGVEAAHRTLNDDLHSVLDGVNDDAIRHDATVCADVYYWICSHNQK